MERATMGTRLSRGAAAALMTAGFATALSAQVAAGGRGSREPRDSVFVRAFGFAKIDTITNLVRAIEHEQYGSASWIELTRKLDSLMISAVPRIMLRNVQPTMRFPAEQMQRGWVGFNAQGPQQIIVDTAGYRVTYYAYPSIISVDPASPADRAGIVPGDLLVAFNGTDVVGHEFNLSRLFIPERRVGVTIRRDGENKDYSLDVVKTPEGVFNRRMEFSRVPGAPLPPGEPDVVRIEIAKDGEHVEAARLRSGEGGRSRGGMISPRSPVFAGPLMAGRFMVVSSHGVFGADVSPVGADLAKALRLEKGMLVNDAPEESPAHKAGLRAGDVIVSVSGQSVVTLGELQDQVMSHFGDRSVAMQIIRDKKPVKITVTW